MSKADKKSTNSVVHKQTSGSHGPRSSSARVERDGLNFARTTASMEHRVPLLIECVT